MSVHEKLYTSLSFLHTMLTRYRGFEGHPDTYAAFRAAQKIRMLPMDTTHYSNVCWLIYRLNLLPMPTAHMSSNDRTIDVQNNRANAEWLALHTRNLFYTHPDKPVAHSGITYSIVLVVVSMPTGAESNAKVKHARNAAQHILDSLRERNLPATAARVINVVLGARPKTPAGLEQFEKDVSMETWYTEELMNDILEHELVPPHIPWESLSAEDRKRVPKKTAEIADDPKCNKMALDVLLETDPIARWYGFARDQIICVKRSQLFEGGTNYTLRCVQQH